MPEMTLLQTGSFHFLSSHAFFVGQRHRRLRLFDDGRRATAQEVRRLIWEVISPPLKEELAALESEGKRRLFAGVLVGAELGIEDWSSLSHSSRPTS